MSACLEAVAPAGACNPPAEARAARLTKFEREQLIVDYLNRGVSVAEIAARVGVGEKRMRAIIRDPRTGIRGLARRMPHAPEEFVAIQVSRLNEALLVAFSAMSPTNLKAVDQVVKIVRELDRYGGAFAAEWRRSQPPRIDAPAEGAADFVGAWSCSAELALQNWDAAPPNLAAGERPEIPAQRLEKVKSTPGIANDPLAPLQRGEGRGEGLGRLAADTRQAVALNLVDGERPEIPPQSLEKIKSAPGIAKDPLAPLQRGEGRGEGLGRLAADARPAVAINLIDGERPEIPPQSLENVESAPENGWLEWAASGSGSLPSPLVPYPSRSRSVRMAPNGVMPC